MMVLCTEVSQGVDCLRFSRYAGALSMHTFIVYAHLLAASVSIGVLLMQDVALWHSRHRALTKAEIASLLKTESVVFIALLILWVTGIALVVSGYLSNPQEYLANQKLWAKFSVVVVLTMNGFFLHHYSFPKVTGNKGVLQLPINEQHWIGCSGAVSTLSWFFACYLGIARTWNHTVSYENIMFLYLGFMCAAFVFVLEVMRVSRTYGFSGMGSMNSPDRDGV